MGTAVYSRRPAPADTTDVLTRGVIERFFDKVGYPAKVEVKENDVIILVQLPDSAHRHHCSMQCLNPIEAMKKVIGRRHWELRINDPDSARLNRKILIGGLTIG